MVKVKAGVAPPLDEPENPFAEDIDTDVTVPEPLLLNVVQSVLERNPLTLPDAWLMLIAGVAPPEDAIGAVPVTEVTPLATVPQAVFVPSVVKYFPELPV